MAPWLQTDQAEQAFVSARSDDTGECVFYKARTGDCFAAVADQFPPAFFRSLLSASSAVDEACWAGSSVSILR